MRVNAMQIPESITTFVHRSPNRLKYTIPNVQPVHAARRTIHFNAQIRPIRDARPMTETTASVVHAIQINRIRKYRKSNVSIRQRRLSGGCVRKTGSKVTTFVKPIRGERTTAVGGDVRNSRVRLEYVQIIRPASRRRRLRLMRTATTDRQRVDAGDDDDNDNSGQQRF